MKDGKDGTPAFRGFPVLEQIVGEKLGLWWEPEEEAHLKRIVLADEDASRWDLWTLVSGLELNSNTEHSCGAGPPLESDLGLRLR
jgi:hypothetical protein